MAAQHPQPTNMDGGSAGFASLHGCNLLGQCICTGLRADNRSCNICTSTIRGGRIRVTQERLPRSKKPAMQVMVVDKCVRFMSLAVNGGAVIVNNRFNSAVHWYTNLFKYLTGAAL